MFRKALAPLLSAACLEHMFSRKNQHVPPQRVGFSVSPKKKENSHPSFTRELFNIMETLVRSRLAYSDPPPPFSLVFLVFERIFFSCSQKQCCRVMVVELICSNFSCGCHWWASFSRVVGCLRALFSLSTRTLKCCFFMYALFCVDAKTICFG